MKFITPLFLIITGFSYGQNYTQYVNTFIGTGGHGHTYPGATVPFGFMQLSPDTRPDGYNDWDGCSGYHITDSIIYGFSHTHLSGTGIADYCDILLMPTVGKPQWNNIMHNDPLRGYTSKFDHATERSAPGYYSVTLEDENIPVELTATARVGFHNYKFPVSEKANIILDLTHRDRLLEGSYIEIISPTKVQGLRRSSSWAKDQWLYFAIEFSQPFQLAEMIDSASLLRANALNFKPVIMSGKQLKSNFQFNATGAPIMVKCALSPVSCAGAWKNMEAEIPHWDFNKTVKEADAAWNKELSKIEVTSLADEIKSLSDTTNKLVIFYTALYHCMLAPNIYEDVDGKYRGRDNKIHTSEDFDYYTVFSLWDTYRALHPLLTIIDQKRTNDFINTFLKQYEQGGRLPVWELSSNETECMIGYHAVSVIADAAVKGIRGYDMNLAYEAMKHSANLDHFGLKFYKEKGYIESNEEPESVSKTLEYSYDDGCIAQMGSILKSDDNTFMQRSYNYYNLIDENGFARPRFNGGWHEPFIPNEVNFNYTEANAWQYSFYPPEKIFVTQNAEKMLDEFFTASTELSGRGQADITGLIGQYAHGNEPSHHIAYLYNAVGAYDKAQYYSSMILDKFYSNQPDGLIGNEDCGQMSAWYILSSIGLYQVSPGSPGFTFASPIFDEVKINLENGERFSIKTENNTGNNIYIKRILLNGAEYKLDYLLFNVINSGGTLKFQKTDNRELVFKPISLGHDGVAPPFSPIIESEKKPFTDSLMITISQIIPAPGETFYTMDGSEPDEASTAVTLPFSFYINSTTTIKAKTKNRMYYNKLGTDAAFSSTSTAEFKKFPAIYSIQYLKRYSSQYAANGDFALIDGLRGDNEFRTGMWQGWQGENMEVVLDLGAKREIARAGAGFLQDVRSWIWMPSELEILISDDGKNFTPLTKLKNTVSPLNYESKEIQNMSVEFIPVKTRYVKFIGVNYGIIPAWHPGNGNTSWVFSDEVWVE